jgi:hypothetical protein
MVARKMEEIVDLVVGGGKALHLRRMVRSTGWGCSEDCTEMAATLAQGVQPPMSDDVFQYSYNFQHSYKMAA